MPANYADEPESNWTYSHALAEGDGLVDAQYDDGTFEVATVHDDGSVTLRNPENWNETKFSEKEITGALADGNLETPSGESSELAAW